MEVSPLVTWLWLGAIIAAFGGLIALWPVPRRSPRGALSVRGRGASAPSPSPPATAPEPVRERELV
jgi:hypothetical protein